MTYCIIISGLIRLEVIRSRAELSLVQSDQSRLAMEEQLNWENIEIIETDATDVSTPKIFINKVSDELSVEFRSSKTSQLLTPTLHKRGN